MKAKQPIEINLDGIEIHELAVFLQEGAKALPEFAAACQCNMQCNCGPCLLSCGGCSCSPDIPDSCSSNSDV